MKHTIKCYATYMGAVALSFLITTLIVLLLIMTPGCQSLRIERMEVYSEGNATIIIDAHKVVSGNPTATIPLMGL